MRGRLVIAFWRRPIPLWAFSDDPIYLGLGAFLMMFLVQGCFGVVPAHLNELSPPEVRGTFPGFVYQFGNLLAAGTCNNPIADRRSDRSQLQRCIGDRGVCRHDRDRRARRCGAGGARRENGQRSDRRALSVSLVRSLWPNGPGS